MASAAVSAPQGAGAVVDVGCDDLGALFTITTVSAPERKRGGADVEADLFDYCPVFTHSLLGVSKEGR